MPIATLSRAARRLARAVLATVSLTAATRVAEAQIPGLPVLQGAFPAPGLAAAANVGRAEGRSLFAGAIGYGHRTGRFGLAAGVGTTTPAAPGFGGTRIGYGARAAVTAFRFAGDRLAVVAFAGFGSARSKIETPSLTGVGADTGTVGEVIQADQFPIGVSAGWRVGLGATRALALSIAPMYAFYRRSGADVDATSGRFRTAAVAEVAVTPRIGVTVGTEFGQSATGTNPGPRESSLGVAVSFAFARRSPR